MANLNRVFLMGNLTRDIELRNTSSNLAIAKFGLAVNRRWRTPEGEDREEVTFVDCDAFGRTAETLAKYLSKGRPVFIEGRLKLDQWEDKEGNKRSKLGVVVETFQFIDSKPGGGSGGGGGGSGGGYSDSGDERPRTSRPPARSGGGGGGGGGGGQSRTSPPDVEHVSEDDIPF
jgi:single-strand DNA-binding protein